MARERCARARCRAVHLAHPTPPRTWLANGRALVLRSRRLSGLLSRLPALRLLACECEVRARGLEGMKHTPVLELKLSACHTACRPSLAPWRVNAVPVPGAAQCTLHTPRPPAPCWPVAVPPSSGRASSPASVRSPAIGQVVPQPLQWVHPHTLLGLLLLRLLPAVGLLSGRVAAARACCAGVGSSFFAGGGQAVCERRGRPGSAECGCDVPLAAAARATQTWVLLGAEVHDVRAPLCVPTSWLTRLALVAPGARGGNGSGSLVT